MKIVPCSCSHDFNIQKKFDPRLLVMEVEFGWWWWGGVGVQTHFRDKPSWVWVVTIIFWKYYHSHTSVTRKILSNHQWQTWILNIWFNHSIFGVVLLDMHYSNRVIRHQCSWQGWVHKLISWRNKKLLGLCLIKFNILNDNLNCKF